MKIINIVSLKKPKKFMLNKSDFSTEENQNTASSFAEAKGTNQTPTTEFSEQQPKKNFKEKMKKTHRAQRGRR